MEAISRIRNHELKGKSADLTRMQSDLGRIQEIRKDLRAARVEAVSVDTVEAMFYVTGFLRTVRNEEVKADQAEAHISGLIEHKREEVMEAWRGVRSVDRLRDSAVAQMLSMEVAAETAVNDERNLIAYGRARRAAR